MNSYKELRVWQKSFQVSLDIYKITAIFPRSEIHGLASQMRRASVSVVSNITEGASRKVTAEYIWFLRIAFASAAELETQLLIASKLTFLSEKEFERINRLLTEVLKMLNVLIKRLKIKKELGTDKR